MGEDASSAWLDFLFPLMLCYVYPNPVSLWPVYSKEKAKYGVLGKNPGGGGLFMRPKVYTKACHPASNWDVGNLLLPRISPPG